MPKPLPVELRQRVVNADNNNEGTYEELAERFHVGRASVNRWLQRARAGDLAPKARPVSVPSRRKLKAEHLEFLRQTIVDIPDSSAPGLVQGLLEEFGLKVSDATVKRARRELGFTPKRGEPKPVERDREDVVAAREAWVNERPAMSLPRTLMRRAAFLGAEPRSFAFIHAHMSSMGLKSGE